MQKLLEKMIAEGTIKNKSQQEYYSEKEELLVNII